MFVKFVEDLIADPAKLQAFSQNPNAFLDAAGISGRERHLIQVGDRLELKKILGDELFEKYDRAVANIDIHPFYPGTATFEISNIHVLPTKDDPLHCTIKVIAHWREHGLPPTGAPSWVQVHVYDEAGKEIPDRPGSFVVPSVMDLADRRGEAIRTLDFPRPGRYHVVIDAGGSREVLPSQPKYIDIKS
jgi:hypothetical protein